MDRTLRRTLLTLTSGLALFAGGAVGAQTMTGEEVLENICASCHVESEGRYSRIDDVRKTPEAWDMTVVRMMRNQHVDLTPDERIAVVRYLADTRGLTVRETEGYRYILEREPVAEDIAPNDLMAETCSRCHSFARIALQRRTEEDWSKLMHFHLGQFPTLEIQAMARDRDTWGLMQNDVVAWLSENQPLGDAPTAFDGDLSGAWVVAGQAPGRGDYSGTMTLEKDGEAYVVSLEIFFENGTETYEGRGHVLGEGEWRASLDGEGRTIRQVMALQDDALSGRWFETDAGDVIGGRMAALPETAPTKILAVSPRYVKSGEAVEVTVTGTGLNGELSLSDGVNSEIVNQSATQVTLLLTGSGAEGVRTLRIGDAETSVVVYNALDRITVEPAVTISRIGGNGGPIPKVPAQFEAIGYLNGADGEAGTEDDIRVGVFDAEWTTDNWNEIAAATEDAKYAGQIDASGRFTPGDAGPNPERYMSANNVGDLKVIATVTDGDKTLSGEGHLYATVQRFVDPPIR